MNQERSSEREGDGIMNNKNKSLADKIPKRVWLLISFAVAMLFWYILSRDRFKFCVNVKN